MSAANHLVLIHNPYVIWDEVDGTMTLFHLETREFFHLDEVGEYIWKGCDGSSTVETIVSRLAEEYPTEPPERIKQEVHSFVSLLHDARLLQFEHHPDTGIEDGS